MGRSWEATFCGQGDKGEAHGMYASEPSWTSIWGRPELEELMVWSRYRDKRQIRKS